MLSSKQKLKTVTGLIGLCSMCAAGQGQLGAPHAAQQDGMSISAPVATGVLGQKDPAALSELTNHLKAVGLAPWLGMQGTGEITYADQSAQSYQATLSNLDDDKYRLDAQGPKGSLSIRLHGKLGRTQSGSGSTTQMFADSAMTGLFPFEMLRVTRFPAGSASLIDRGLSKVGTRTLRRITYEFPSLGRNPVTKRPDTIAIDFYFDVDTHLLARSVVSTRVASARSPSFLVVVDYSDYRSIGGSLIPFLYTETMDGEPYWTLQLSDAKLGAVVDPKYFEF